MSHILVNGDSDHGSALVFMNTVGRTAYVYSTVPWAVSMVNDGYIRTVVPVLAYI